MTSIYRMYAHVYFQIASNQLSIAVYGLGKIPGFSGALDEELQETTKQKKAYDLFVNILGQDSQLSKEELQQGRIFNYNQLKEQLNTLNLLGKLIAKDTEAQVVIDLDDPNFWLELEMRNISDAKREIISKLPIEKKNELGNKLKEKAMEKLLASESSEDLHASLQKAYIAVSRGLYPQTGPKDFPGTKKYPSPTPPTFLVSKEYDFAYYPGFRGAHYMTKTPSSDLYVYPHEKDTPHEEKWMTDIIQDTTEYTNSVLASIDPKELDYITEVLARLFFKSLPETSKAGFNRALIPVKNKAITMLSALANEAELKTASSIIGTWIDLNTGLTYKSEQQLLAAAASDRPQERALAAEKIIKCFVKHGKLKVFLELMRDDE
jgi:hypothetical protein